MADKSNPKSLGLAYVVLGIALTAVFWFSFETYFAFSSLALSALGLSYLTRGDEAE